MSNKVYKYNIHVIDKDNNASVITYDADNVYEALFCTHITGIDCRITSIDTIWLYDGTLLQTGAIPQYSDFILGTPMLHTMPATFRLREQYIAFLSKYIISQLYTSNSDSTTKYIKTLTQIYDMLIAFHKE